jgi:hypothetical protein
METFLKKTCRELYRRTVLTEARGQEITDEELDDTLMCEPARPWEEQWESLKADESVSWKKKTITRRFLRGSV